MEKEIYDYLSKYIPITEALEEELSKIEFIQRFEKGHILLEEGRRSKACYFILKGCIRSYYLKDGEEKTTEFYTEEQAVIPAAYGSSSPSAHYLECTEDTIAGVGTPELEAGIYQKFPQVESLNRALGDAIMANTQSTFAEFKMASPEERYLSLLKKRPDLVQRAPQHQIASYLGMTPESLSRIRKRLQTQK